MVQQLRFVRSELRRALADVDDADARRRFLPMNCISWNIGHLAWQEQRYWLTIAARASSSSRRSTLSLPTVAPASTPPLAAMLQTWQAKSPQRLTRGWTPSPRRSLTEAFVVPGWGVAPPPTAHCMLRVIDHYWYHIGESMAIRQLLGHTNLPDFVGDIDGEAPYCPEQD
jgi:hypothetical protein